MARAIVDEDRGVLIGATFVGPDVAELLHSATIAIVGEVPIDRLWHAVPSYPTRQRGVAALARGVRPPDRLKPRRQPPRVSGRSAARP